MIRSTLPLFCMLAAFAAGLCSSPYLFPEKGESMNASQGSDALRGMASKSTEQAFFEHRSSGNADLGGVYQREGLNISWAGSDPLDSRVRPKDVIAATVQRLEAEQQTDLGSDANARAMTLLMQANAILNGQKDQSDFGPIVR